MARAITGGEALRLSRRGRAPSRVALFALFALFAAAFSSPAAFAGQLLLQTDTQTLTEGQVGELHLTAVDETPTGPPEIPDSDGLRFSYQGQRHSTTMINFKTTRTVTFTYRMIAAQAGRWSVGPVQVELGSRKGRTNKLAIQVDPREDSDSADGIFATLGAEKLYVGQTVVYHLEFRSRQSLQNLRWTPPEFEGFVPEQTAEIAQKRYSLVDAGVEVEVVELDSPLVATAPGAREIPPAVIQAEIWERQRPTRRRGLFSNMVEARAEVFTADPLPTRVHPLPEAGRDEAWSGLVGRFNVRAELAEAEVAAGGSTTLTVIVQGDGTLSGFSLPPPPDGAGYRAYDDQPEVSAEIRGGRFRSIARFRRAIVPEAPGPLTLAPIEIQAFDPVAGEYVTLRSRPLRLKVTEGESRSAVTSYAGAAADSRQEVAELAEDILPLHASARLRSQVFRPTHPGLLALVGLPLLGLLGLFGRDLAAARGGRPDRRGALRARIAAAAEGDLGAWEGIFREAAGVALDLPAASIDRARLEAGLPPALAEEALAVYQAIEAARYGGGDPGDLIARVRALVGRLEVA